MDTMWVALVLLMWGCIDVVHSECQLLTVDFVCTKVPSSFPVGMTSVVLFMNNVGHLNSTVFNSDSLSSVTSLTLTNNGITDLSPRALHAFQQLINLKLDGNHLAKINHTWFSHPEKLQNITLYNNSLEAVDQADLSNFTGLISLNLSRNHIHTISRGSFSALHKLAHLDLSVNRLMHLNPMALNHLKFTKVRLDGNPWDCSCGRLLFGEFVVFLKGLQNASCLENETAVTCSTPAVLRGRPVWNISCLQLDVFVPSTTPHTPVVGLTIGYPGLIFLIVALCALVCGVCVLSALYCRKYLKKQVNPCCGSPIHAVESQVTDCHHMDSVKLTQSNRIRDRSKSAGPVLSRTEFLSQNYDKSGNPHKDHRETEARLHSLSPDDKSRTEKEKNENALQKKIPQNEIAEEKESMFERRFEQGHRSSPEDMENLPYLTIDTKTAMKNVESKKHHCCHDGSGLAPRKSVRRVATWPVLIKEQSSDSKDVIRFIFLPKFNTDVIAGCKDNCPPGNITADPQVSVTALPSNALSSREDDRVIVAERGFRPGFQQDPLLPVDYNVDSDNGQFIFEPVKQLEVSQDHPEPDDRSRLRTGVSRKRGSITEGCGSRTQTNQEERARAQTETPLQEGGANGRCSGSGSLAPPTGGSRSPGDDNLLLDNEYAFIDLLHEVVENQGRWTRERWKQTHTNKQRTKR